MAEKESRIFNTGNKRAEEQPQSEVPPAVLQDLQDIAQRVGGDFKMAVKIGESGQGSYFDHENTAITLDPEHVTKKPEMARFVALHEGAHRAITPGPRKLGLGREETRQLYSQLGFGYLHNVIEDGAVNTWGRRRFPGIEEDMKKVYDEQFAQENAVLATPEVQNAADRLGYWPKFAHAGSEYLRLWHQDRYSTQLDPQVDKTLGRTGKIAREIMEFIPEPSSTVREEADIVRMGKKRWQTTTDRIWPEFKKLVAEDEHTESLRQMMNNDEAWEQLPSELKDALEQAIKQFRPAQESTSAGGEETKEMPLPLDMLPDEVKKQLEEAWQNVPHEQRRVFEQRAREELKIMEDALNKGLRGKLQRSEDIPETHGEAQEREARERSAAEQSRQKSEDNHRLQNHLEEQRRENMTPYEQIRTEVEPLIDDLHRRLRVILLPEEFGGEEAGWPSSQQLDTTRAMQSERDPTQLGKLWIRESEPSRRDYRFWQLVDVSESMEGEPINETIKGVVTVSEAVDRLENRNSESMTVRQGISAFHNRYFEIKTAKQRIDSDVTSRIASLPEKTNDEDADTNTYRATMKSLGSLRQDLGEGGNYLLTFTDGEPNHDVREQLKKLLENGKLERQKRNIQVGLIWLGSEASDEKVQRLVQDYGYDFGLAMPAIAKAGERDFSNRLADLLEDIVRRTKT